MCPIFVTPNRVFKAITKLKNPGGAGPDGLPHGRSLVFRFGGLGRAPKARDVERRRRENRGAEGAEGGGVRKIFDFFNVKMAYFGVYLKYSEVFILKNWFAT